MTQKVYIRTIMTAQKQDLSAIKASLLKIAQDIGEPASPVAAPQDGSPEQIMQLVEEAINVLEVAEEQIPAENPGEEPAAAPAPNPAMAKSNTKSAQEDGNEEEDKQKEAQDDSEDEEKKEMTARIAALESELEGRKRVAIAEEFANLYPEDIRQAKFDEIANGKDSLDILTAQLKTAKDIVEANKPAPTYIPATSQSGYLTKKASLNTKSFVPAWRT